MRKHFPFACLAAAGALPCVAHAHHGLDFLLVQTAHLPEKGTGYVFGRVNRLDGDESENDAGERRHVRILTCVGVARAVRHREPGGNSSMSR